MIDHVAARRLAATAIDLPLEAGDADELDGHLATCPACRNVSAALGRDAAALRHLDFGPVPVAVRADVAIAAERGRPSPFGRWVGLAVVGALLVVALGSGILGGAGAGRSPDPGVADDPAAVSDPVDWRTGVIDIHATDVWIQAGDHRLGGASEAAVKASMDSDTRTFEATWAPPSDAVIVRLFIVSQNGRWLIKGAPAHIASLSDQWLDAQGPFIGSELGIGERVVGDVDLDLISFSGEEPVVLGTLHLRDLVIKLGAVPVPPDQPQPVVPGQAPPLPATPIASADPNDGIPTEDTPTP
jgi:hypothetical protein